MLKIGHRGAAGHKPENTLASFQKALDLGVDMIELDVYVLKDGHVVVFHDDKVDRTTNGTGLLLDKTFKETQELNAGLGERIPTLQGVLDLVDSRVQINIELKGSNTAEPVAAIIETYVKGKNWSYNDFFVSSFNYKELKKFKSMESKVRIGVLVSDNPMNYLAFAEMLNAYAINLDMVFVTHEFVEKAHKKGLKVFVWTVNEPKDVQRVKSFNVDGIFSDYPNRL